MGSCVPGPRWAAGRIAITSGALAPAGGGLRVPLDERERPSPGVVGGVLVLLLLAVEEGVGRPVIGDDLVLEAGGGQRRIERGVHLGRDVGIVAGLKREDGRRHLGGAARRSDPAFSI